VLANNFIASASVESVNNVGTSFFIAPCNNRSANNFALSLFSPMTILEGYKLSYKAFPSLKNSGENIIF
jgi:hypothetical protein